MENAPFYAAGLKFECQRCSACCRYDEGFVYLSENDIDKLAAHFKMDRKRFIGVYCRQVNGRYEGGVLSLKERANKDCIFWDNGCSIYEYRPLQCRTFPFWENIVDSAAAWDMASTGCPGINRGAFYSKEEIDAFLEMHKKEQFVGISG